MTLWHEQKWDEVRSEERSSGKNRAVWRNFVWSDNATDTENEVRAYLASQYAPTYFELPLASIVVDERIEDRPANPANGVAARQGWSATVTYETGTGESKKPKPGEEGETFTVWEIRAGGGETMSMQASLALIQEKAVNQDYEIGTFSDFARILGIKRGTSSHPGENSGHWVTEGVPVPLGSIEIVAHAWKSNATVTAGYMGTVSEWAARNAVNVADWKVFPAKTLRIVDFQAKQQVGEDSGWEMTFNFSYSAKVTAAELNASLPTLDPFTEDKQGHHVLDILHCAENIQPKNFTLQIPYRAAIHQVYPEINYTTVLQI